MNLQFCKELAKKEWWSKNPIPPNFFLCQLVDLLGIISSKSRIFFFLLRQNLIFQTLSSVCMFTRLRKKNEGNFRVTACMIKTRSLSKWSHLLEISKGATIRFKIWSNTQHQCFWEDWQYLGILGALRGLTLLNSAQLLDSAWLLSLA